MRGIDSIANATTPRAASRSIPSRSESGSRNPMRTWPSCSRAASPASGLRTLATASASHGLPRATPASPYASSGKEAAAPAPGSTTTSKPAAASFPAVSGTSATLRSPGAVSRGTPTLICANSRPAAAPGRVVFPQSPRGRAVHSPVGDAFLHAPRAAAPLRGRDARVVRDPVARRDGADRLRRSRLARELRDRVGDLPGGPGRGRRRQPRLLGDRTVRRPGALPPLAVAVALRRPRASRNRATHEATRRQDGLLRPFHRGAALHGGVGRRPRPHALVALPVLEHGGRGLLGRRGRPRPPPTRARRPPRRSRPPGPSRPPAYGGGRG